VVGVGSGSAESTFNSDVTAYLGPKGAATLPLANRTSVDATGTVSIGATSSQFAKSDAVGGGGGGVGISSADSTPTTGGATTAYVGDQVNITRANKVAVTAESVGAAAQATVTVGTGGLISVGANTADARSTPSVSAYLGKGVSAVVHGDLEVKAIGRA